MLKVDILNVLALAMCGLALLSVFGVYFGTWLLINLKSLFAKYLWGAVTVCSMLLLTGAVNTASALSDFSNVVTNTFTGIALFVAFAALAAATAEADLRQKGEIRAIVPAE